MTERLVLHGVGVDGTAWVLSRPGALAPAAAPEVQAPSLSQQLEHRYREGVQDGRHAQAQQDDAERRAVAAQELELAMAEAAREGYAQGQARAVEEASKAAATASQELARRITALEAVTRSVAGQLHAALDDVEDELVGLCHEVICRILGEVAATADGVRALVAQALRDVSGRVAAVHLHPDDLAILGAVGGASADSGVRWVADSTVALGGALLKSQAGTLDARLETQLKALSESLWQTRMARRAQRMPAS